MGPTSSVRTLNKGSDFDAIKALLDDFGHLPTVRVYLYHEKSRTFHPKVYLFDAEADARGGPTNERTGALPYSLTLPVEQLPVRSPQPLALHPIHERILSMY